MTTFFSSSSSMVAVLQRCAFAFLLLVGTAATAQEARHLFDGHTLKGWDGDLNYWRVENGAIVGEIPKGQSLNKNTWLIWKDGTLGDFDLRVQVKLTGLPAANSGIQFRCQAENVDHVSGYQADFDMGAVWLGRIYDEHGRALLVERGTRVAIDPSGKRQVEAFAPAGQYAVLFRENDWNDYRIVAIGDRVSVYVNGTLFSELKDQQTGEQDLKGQLAFQLHSGPETRVEFRNIRLEDLKPDDARLPPFHITPQPETNSKDVGVVPVGADGKPLNLGFESGDLTHWTATGNAFDRQPVNNDGISQRWPGQVSNKNGNFFIGGYELVQDRGTGTLTSAPFKVTHPFGSFLIGGGQDASTRAEFVLLKDDGTEDSVLFAASGRNQEQMRRVAVDLSKVQGRTLQVRVVDENPGGWGHINFDDVRLHDEAPEAVEGSAVWRSTFNPVLQHLKPNLVPSDKKLRGSETTNQMFVPEGFSVEVIAAEPHLHQPMAFTFDAKGRLWVVEGHCYPQRRPEGQGIDRILIFEDRDANGSWETRSVFTEGLNLVSGLEVGFGGVWVGAAPQLLFIPDANGDDKPDSAPQVLLDGFDYADTHETINNFQWGPDGWLYGNQGVFNASMIGKPGSSEQARQKLGAGVWRYHPTKHTFEVFAHGGSNQWGLDYDDFGQFFMTHCRSFWGRGGTTHVMQGGHYWNQGNSGYAPFVSSEALPGMPWMKNYLLASARYDHGEGGAGKPGTDAVYGGHSHVGTMIYLGDNWPASYRNHLFTHNLHGHQINHQINVRDQGGFNSQHAGQDMLFCADRQYIGVDLQYGPDGAVYISDWYDPRHCHNPDTEQWDRGNGRMYRMKYDATWKPVRIDYTAASDDALADAQLHANDWHVRTARRVLSERAASRAIAESAVAKLRDLALKHDDAARRVRGLWALHAIGQLNDAVLKAAMADQSEFVRAWVIQLGIEVQSPVVLGSLVNFARNDGSLLICRYLASAVQRVPSKTAWEIAEALGRRTDLESDRDLPSLLWFGVAPLVVDGTDRAMSLAKVTPSATLRDNIIWYAAKTSEPARQAIAVAIKGALPDSQLHLLRLLELAVRGRRGLAVPSAWSDIAVSLYDSKDPGIRSTAESIGAAFGDTALYARMRTRLQDANTKIPAKRQAIQVLSADPALENLPVLMSQLETPELVSDIIPQLGRYDDAVVPETLLKRLVSLPEAEKARALEVLCSRVAWANMTLDQIAAGTLPKNQLTAFYARQMASLGDAALKERLQKEWGTLGQSSEEVRKEILQLSSAYKAAPLWAYDGNNGAAHFKKLCAQCHLPNQQNEAIAPKLAGTGAKGVEYVVENVLNPNAVIGRDYLARIIVTKQGRVITGLVEKESDTSLTIRTLNSSETVAKDDIEETSVSTNSFMPEGLLKTLNDREKIELLKYLMGQ